ncbi:MAG: hypothetical protein WCB18_09450 [Thermoplasmata archaeon]
MAILIIGLAASPGNPLLYAHSVCATTNFVEQESLYTPLGLSNAPYQGYVNYTAVYDVPGQPGIRTTDSAPYTKWIEGDFFLMNWSLFRSATQYVAGPGPDSPCSSSWEASVGGAGYPLSGIAGDFLNATPSDVNSPSNLSQLSPGPARESVIFDISYHDDTGGRVDTCGYGPAHLNLHSTSLVVEVPFVTQGHAILVTGSIPVELYLNYSFPNNSGSWLIDNLDLGANAPGTGIATDWSAC